MPSRPMPLPPPSRPSCGAMICSRSHCSAAPPVSWLLPTSGNAGSSPGIVAIEWKMSVRLNGTRALIHDVVEIATCVSYGRTAPEPTTAACTSGMPQTTGAPGATPISAATSAVSAPSTEPVGQQLGQAVAVAAGAAYEVVVVAVRGAGPVVGEPARGHRGRCRGGAAGEAHAEVVDRLEQHPGAVVDLAHPALQQQRVAGRVGAAGRRRAGGGADERQHLVRGVAGDAHRAAEDLVHERAGAGVGPQQHRARRARRRLRPARSRPTGR